MSQSNKIECPSCSHEIDVDRILYSQIEKESKRRYEQELNKQNKIVKDKLDAIKIQENNLQKDK